MCGVAGHAYMYCMYVCMYMIIYRIPYVYVCVIAIMCKRMQGLAP